MTAANSQNDRGVRVRTQASEACAQTRGGQLRARARACVPACACVRVRARACACVRVRARA
eukprot:6211034-Pleurochrysis_carterae.AAC.1